jgi:hypothetical protein
MAGAVVEQHFAEYALSECGGDVQSAINMLEEDREAEAAATVAQLKLAQLKEERRTDQIQVPMKRKTRSPNASVKHAADTR